jgi:hypothetical protein
VTFDPFGDFESRGYLRNVEQEKDLVKRRIRSGVPAKEHE